MDMKIGRLLATVLKPPLTAIGLVVGGLYNVLFSGYDKRLAMRHEEQLAEVVQNHLTFLFTEMGGHIVPNEDVEFPPPFDYAIITVETRDVRLRFTRGREQLIVQIAPKSLPNSWHELSTVLTVISTPGVQRGSISGFNDAGRVLRLHMNEIKQALGEERYPRLRSQLQEIYERDRIATKQLETEINRRLYI